NGKKEVNICSLREEGFSKKSGVYDEVEVRSQLHELFPRAAEGLFASNEKDGPWEDKIGRHIQSKLDHDTYKPVKEVDVEIIDGQDGNMYLYVGEKNDNGGREIKIGITKSEGGMAKKLTAPPGIMPKIFGRIAGTPNQKDPEQQNYHKIIEKLPTQSLSLSELQNNNTNSNSNKDNKSLYKGLAIGAVVVVLITGLIAYWGGSAATNCSHKSYNPNNLGVKIFGGQSVKKGSIIIRQRGTKYKEGQGVFLGRDYTIHAQYDGV
ncbi:7130_t:CDS:2, partial [Racocetra persica]